MEFSWIAFILTFIAYSIVLILVTATKDVLRKRLEGIIDYFLNLINYKRLVYKRRAITLAREFNAIFSEQIVGEIEESIKVKISGEKNSYQESPKEWKIILVDKTYNVDKVEKSAIMQIPSSMIHEKEKLIMTVPYRRAFTMCLSRTLAFNKEKYDLVQDIEEMVIDSGIGEEYKVISEIVGSSEKFSSFIEEARRKYAFEKGSIGSTNKEEFKDFTEDLARGEVAVINVFSNAVSSYAAEVIRLTSTYKYVYVYARGKNHLKTLEKLHSKLNEMLSGVEVSKIESYDWLDKKGKKMWPAARVKITKRGKKKKHKK